MGIQKQGAFGSFNNKTGNLVGYAWKGRACIRIIPQKVNQPNTKAQLAQRQRFADIGHLIRGMSDAIAYGFHPLQKDKTAQNVFMSYNLANALKGTYPTIEVDFTKILISRGTLVNGATPKCTYADGMVSYTWTDNTGIDNALSDDVVFVGMYHEGLKEGMSFANGYITRKNGGMTITLPERWTTQTGKIDIYTGMVRADFSFASDSLYFSVTA